MAAAMVVGVVLAGCSGGPEADPTPTPSATATPVATPSPTPMDTLDPTVDPTAAPTTPAEPTTEPTSAPPPADETQAPTPLESDGPSDSGGPAFADVGVMLEEDASGDLVTVSGVRTGVHADFERIVLDIEGDGAPGWFVGWVAAPTRAGSGTPIDMAGRAWLRVIATGIPLPTGGGGDTIQQEDIPIGGLRLVRGIHNDNVFEGQQLFHVGTRRARPFRTFLLSDPTRLVVDISTG